MKRRILLGATAAGLAAAAWPAFIRDAFGDSAACDMNGKPAVAAAAVAQVSAAFRRAQKAGKALLVLVIPADDVGKWERGQAFGELLNFGADSDLAPLSDVEVVCATMADLKKIVPGAGNGEPLMVLVRTDKVPATATQLDAKLPGHQSAGGIRPGGWEEVRKQQEKNPELRIRALGDLLRKGLGDDASDLGARAASVRARFVKQPPVGARWARSTGCGTEVEGVDDDAQKMLACGMGHVPEKSRRFLYFFAAPRRGA
ncbi:hypothetical protein [Sorangium sp. So ce233]|uniref:hypothetical protein n=1 Tax=Sorangium sp. So ce233 TaxID=3133290 RepID=UPI003F634F6E